MAQMTMLQAMSETILEEMRRDSGIFIFGWPEGRTVLEYGADGEAAVKEFGRDRIMYTGINELQSAGVAVGAALGGMRPIFDCHRADFCLDGGFGQMVQHAAQMRSKMGLKATCPALFMVFGAPNGAMPPDHSRSFHHWFANSPGLFVIAPSTAGDARGLLRTALRESKDPVVCVSTIDRLSVGGKEVTWEVPDGDYTIPFGKAEVKREGKDVTIAGAGYAAYLALQAAEDLAKEGISAEVWDARSLKPLDRASLIASVQKTGALVAVDSEHKTYGATGEYIATVAEALTPVPLMGRAASMDIPFFYPTSLRTYVAITKDKIIAAAKAVLARKGGQAPANPK